MRNQVSMIVTSMVATAVSVSVAQAQGYGAPPKLIHPAQFGEAREVLGAALLVAQPVNNCPQSHIPVVGGPCLQTAEAWMKRAGQSRVRVVSATYQVAAGDRVGAGNGYTLYDVSLEGGNLTAVALPYTSDVFVPRGCYRLNGEDIVYRIEARDGYLAAQETQIVMCGGGPQQPRGPYQPVGETIPAIAPAIGVVPQTGDSYRRTEFIRVQGTWRFLAMPEADCDKSYIVRKVYCARSGIQRLQANASEKELDLIGAVRPVFEGEALGDKDVEQLVLKRQSKGFKADKRWFKKSMLGMPRDCAAYGNDGVFVRRHEAELYAVEEVNARCGAPLAPVPADIYEAYAEAAVPVAMVIRDCPPNARLWGEYCFRDAIDYMQAYGYREQTVLLANRHVYDGDYMFNNGPYGSGYQRVTVRRLEDGNYKADTSYSGNETIYLNRCQTYYGNEPEREGYVVYRYRRQVMAVAYQWQTCPVY
ncbi:MAG: hypothetical protein QM645_06345 [Asticcacaulis sp.]